MVSRRTKTPAVTASAPSDDSKTRLVTWIFVGVFLLLVGGLLLYLRLTPEKEYSYRGFPIAKGKCPGTNVECYNLDIRIRTQEYSITFYYHPTDLEDVNVTAQSVAAMYMLQNRKNPQIIMGLPENAPGSIGIAGTELARVLGSRYDIFNFDVVPGIIGDSPGEVSCSNVSTSTIVVLFQQEELTRVYAKSPNCIIVAGRDVRDVVRAADAYSYHLLQVMDTPDLRIGGPLPSTNATNTSERTHPVPPFIAGNNTSAS